MWVSITGEQDARPPVVMTDYNFKAKLSKDDSGWYGTGHLPHLDAAGFTQFITFRLADSLPRAIIEKLKREADDEVGFRKAIEEKLDAFMGECWLGRAEIASVVQSALIYHHKRSYDLHAWVIMPNHGHLLATQLPGKQSFGHPSFHQIFHRKCCK